MRIDKKTEIFNIDDESKMTKLSTIEYYINLSQYFQYQGTMGWNYTD